MPSDDHSTTSDVGVQPASRTSVGDVCNSMPLGRRHIAAGTVLFITFVIEAWEQVGLIYVSTGIGTDFGISNAQLGWALSAVALGMVPGALLWGLAIDRFGRRQVTVYSLLVYSVLALLAGLSPEFWMFLVLRFLSGMAFGGVYSVTFPYFLELLPTRWRGQGAVALSIGFPIGTLLCIGVSQTLGTVSWRAVAVVGAVAGLWAFAVRKWVPESPYWLAQRERHADAARVLRSLGGTVAEAPGSPSTRWAAGATCAACSRPVYGVSSCCCSSSRSRSAGATGDSRRGCPCSCRAGE